MLDFHSLFTKLDRIIGLGDRLNRLGLRQLSGILVPVFLSGAVALTSAQTPGSAKPLPLPSPATTSASPVPSPVPSPPIASPVATPFAGPTLPVAPLNPGNRPTAPAISSGSVNQTANPLTLDDVLRLANAQASVFQQAGLNEKIAAEDVKQAQAAFLPRVSIATDYIYTSPLIGGPPGTPREPSFIANNAINEYQALLNVAGDVDLSGKLRATLAKNRALLAAAHAGTEVARRALAQAVVESYYGLALASAQLRAAEQNLAAAEEFERVTSLLLSGGEVAPVDLTRAQLQTTARRDELEKARANEAVAAGSLRVLVGYDFLRPIATTELTIAAPVADDVSRLTADLISTRPEFAQFEATRQAAAQEVRIARAERLPQLSYSVNGGFDTDSMHPSMLKQHSGVSAAFNLSIPIFDWGASRSRERQARWREQIAESERALALRGFAEQFYSARAQVVSAAARIRLAAAGITLAENNLNASIARYRSGEAQIIEVTDAESTLVAQRQAFYQALFDYQVALAHLRQAAGR